MVKAVVGANWGDEEKERITDMLAKEADIIVRFQGGAKCRSYDRKMITESLHFTHYRQVYFTDTPQA